MPTRREMMATHRQLRTWVNRGKLSPDVSHAAQRLLCDLWACANNDPIPRVLFVGLVDSVDALARAKAGCQ